MRFKTQVFKMRVYNIDVNITQKCTFACDYCFATCEEKTLKDFYDPSVLKRFIFKLLESKWFKDNYDFLSIGLWGGEPTTRPEIVVDLINTFMFDNVKFFLFTNGYNINDDIWQTLVDTKEFRVDGQPKVNTQISYDGRPIHDIYRRTKGNLLTSAAVRNQIKRFDEESIPFVIKSTVTADTFKYMYWAYRDIKELYKKLKNTPINYFPTIDHYENSPGLMLEVYKKELEHSLIKIANEEQFIKGGQFFFKWFNNNRALCAAGYNAVAIDVDGTIYTCHGCLYDDKQTKFKHRISRIGLDTVVNDLEAMHKEFAVNIMDDKECKKCDVNFCLRCNHAKYSKSKKQGYLDKWRDFTNQPNLCEFYKINSIVTRSMKEMKEITRRK